MFKKGDLVVVSDEAYEDLKNKMKNHEDYDEFYDVCGSELTMTYHQTQKAINKAVMEVERIDDDGDIIMVGRKHLYWDALWLKLAEDEIEGEEF